MRASGSLVARPSRAVMRARSSAAARRPKVSTSTCSGSAPAAIRATTASTSVVVLPVPGPASTSSGPPGWSTTSCCAGVQRRDGRRGRAARPDQPVGRRRGTATGVLSRLAGHVRHPTTTPGHDPGRDELRSEGGTW